MDKKHKCKYCGALLSETNSVFVHISRFDDRGKISKSNWLCCKCWDNAGIDDSLFIDTKGTKHVCGKCSHLIFKDYKHCEGFCEKLRISRRFHYPCVHEEEMS